MRRFLYVLAVALIALEVPSCNIFADYGNAICKNDPAGCAAGGTGGSGTGVTCTGGETLWICNIATAGVTVSMPWFNPFPATNCGLAFCALDAAGAKNRAQGATGVDPNDPTLVCANTHTTTELGFDALALTVQAFASTAGIDANDFESLCVSPCVQDPCVNAYGAPLGMVGESCGTLPDGTTSCCPTFACIDPTTGQPPPPFQEVWSGVCQGTPKCTPQGPPKPNWLPLDTGTLRNICVNNNVKGSASQSGITLNRTCGVAFETWVLKTMGWLPRWSMPIYSMARENKTLGLPKSVIPEQVLDQPAFLPAGWVNFPKSVFVEVKAVNGTLTLGYSQWQIYGLLDGARTWPPVPDAGTHAPPAVFFITTSDTQISLNPGQVRDQATMWNVAVWQNTVYYDANGGINPNLSVGEPTLPNPNLIDPQVYGGVSNYTIWPGPKPQNPLTWATTQEQDAVGAVVEPDPDSPAMVP